MLTPFLFAILNLLFMFYFIQIRQNMRTVQNPVNIDALTYQYIYIYIYVLLLILKSNREKNIYTIYYPKHKLAGDADPI